MCVCVCVCVCVQVVEDGYEFFAKRQLVTLFSAPNYCGDYDNAGGMMTVDEQLFCSFQVRKIMNIVFHIGQHTIVNVEAFGTCIYHARKWY